MTDINTLLAERQKTHGDFKAIAEQCDQALRRVIEHINRSAGQHLRAMKESHVRAMLVKTPTGLRGATPADDEAYRKWRRRLEKSKPGTYHRFESSSPRNGAHHRKMFALLTLVAENSETYDTPEKALVAIKLVVGHFEPAVHPVTGELIQVPKSISYESMDQDEFDAFYKTAVDAVMQHILPQLDDNTAERLLDMISSGWAA